VGRRSTVWSLEQSSAPARPWSGMTRRHGTPRPVGLRVSDVQFEVGHVDTWRSLPTPNPTPMLTGAGSSQSPTRLGFHL
jgi:hypothetical protein